MSFEQLLAVAARFGRTDAPGRYADEKPPLRSELFSTDQLEQHGKKLALVHRLAPSRTDHLLTRLGENEGILVEVCDLLTAAVTANRRITPAAEWLLDNFYLIEEQIRTAKRHLPKGYSRELPRLAHGPSAKLPRVYDLAFEAIAHGDCRIDEEGLSRFVAAYQTVVPLKLGELWAIPIMLRLALIENLRRVAVRIATGAIDRDRARAWADEMVDVAGRDPKSLILVIADMARSNPPMVSSFVAELARRLQGKGAALALPLTWIEERLAESGSTIERLVQSETQEQAGDQVSVPRLVPTRNYRSDVPPIEPRARELILFNGIGGFTPDGGEYVITIRPGQMTPAPWANVLANPNFGSVISESGLAYTWSENAHEFRLTPWYNDPVTDASGEAFFLRDDETGHFWSPAPLPARGVGTYVVRHGFGYSVFEHGEDDISSELWVYVGIDASVKFSVLKIRNTSDRSRRISATGYAEWVLGDLRPKTTMHVITEIEAKSGALLARNSYSTEFADRVAFFDVDDPTRSVSGDRTEFLGRNGALRNPASMARSRLSGKVGATLDPCAAIQVSFELEAGQEREIVFRLGVGRNAADAANVAQRFRGSTAAHGALEAVRAYWKRVLGAVQVDTPDVSLNVLANGWLLYQTLACRLWARSGYYQSGGAFGFRDQLQDVMALIHAEAALTREHLLRSAGRQFVEGDVQHWWHPPSGRGVRTRCSDDYLWLPLATARYVKATGDSGVLDESIPFLEGRPVNPGDDSYYDVPGRSDESASLYEHCVRAIVHGLRSGAHGLPLMGSGDWNDGMNRVGIKGTGESVWLGFFLCAVLAQFAEVARAKGDASFAERCEAERDVLRQNLEQHGWDGGWYRRAYFDDGSPLGSASNAECRIDSIAQSWSVLSGAGDARRSRMAMDAVDEHLVRRDRALIQLLDPPFDRSNLDPGYIKGYVPGVRENGGQYTHGAIWSAMAFAAIGDRERAWELTMMINPVNHARTPEDMSTYAVEPYVIAADVYALAPHTGRGGWSWYTGSAGWMYRLVLESLLGVTLQGDWLRFAPCLPLAWNGFSLRYRYRETYYNIAMRRIEVESETEPGVTVDGVAQSGNAFHLTDDGQEHHVEVRAAAN